MNYTDSDEEGNIWAKIPRCHICGNIPNKTTIPSMNRYKFKTIVIWFCSNEHKIEWMNGNNIINEALTDFIVTEKK